MLHPIRASFCILACIVCISCSQNTSDRPSFQAAILPSKKLIVPDTITIAFYNVENLFDFELDGHEYPEYRPGSFNFTYNILQKKIANIASVILAIKPDILGLCEVEDEDALNLLADYLKKAGHPLPYASVPNSETNTKPMLLSRFPVKNIQSIKTGFGEKYPLRDILECDVALGSSDLKIFVNHWPSKQHPESQRVQVAKALATRIKQMSNTEYIIMGDLNSAHDESVSFKTNRLDNTQGKTGINHILYTMQSLPYEKTRFTTQDMMVKGQKGHYDLWLELPENQRFSHFYRGNKESLDHILLPSTLFDSTGISYLDNSFKVFTFNGKLLKGKEPIRWQMKFSGKHKFHVGYGYSDHLPVVANFVKGSFKPQANNPEQTPGNTATTFDGWVATSGKFSFEKISEKQVSKAAIYLHIKADSVSKNCTVARAILRAKKSSSFISLSLKGSGKICFRVKSPDGEWVYFNPPNFTPAKSAKYELISYQSWTPIAIPFHSNREMPDLEIEVRAGKLSSFNFMIDKVIVN